MVEEPDSERNPGSGHHSTNDTLQPILQQELQRLRQAAGTGHQLKVIWEPDSNSPLDGEVKEEIIRIYVTSKDEALATVRHEFLDWLLVRAVKPYRDMTNTHRLILNAIFKNLEENAYAEKEEVIEALVKLLDANKEDATD
jgi:hypothetical protein